MWDGLNIQKKSATVLISKGQAVDNKKNFIFNRIQISRQMWHGYLSSCNLLLWTFILLVEPAIIFNTMTKVLAPSVLSFFLHQMSLRCGIDPLQFSSPFQRRLMLQFAVYLFLFSVPVHCVVAYLSFWCQWACSGRAKLEASPHRFQRSRLENVVVGVLDAGTCTLKPSSSS